MSPKPSSWQNQVRKKQPTSVLMVEHIYSFHLELLFTEHYEGQLPLETKLKVENKSTDNCNINYSEFLFKEQCEDLGLNTIII